MAICLGVPVLAMAQSLPPPTLPLSGNETIQCLQPGNGQGGSYKACTPNLINAIGGSVTSVALAMPSVFSVAGSPITSAGTFTVTWTTEGANTVFAGPSSGSAATPTFRALVGADLPNPSATTLGGIESAAAVTHEWINSISTSGVPGLSQPAFTDISGTIASGQVSGSYTGITGVGTLTAGAIGTGFTAIPNSALANASTTVNGQTCTLGSTCTVTASATAITVGTTTIGSGTSNGLLYDNGGVLGNLATGASGVLVTSSGSVPSISTTLPSGLSASNFTVTNGTYNGTVAVGSAANWQSALGLGTAATQNTGTSGSTLCLLSSACTYGAKQTFFTSTTSSASINIPQGSTPTTPSNGDLWTTSSGIFAQIAGSTVSLEGCAGSCTFTGSNTLGNAATNVQTLEGDLALTGSGTPTGTCSSISGIDAHGAATMPSSSSCTISFAHTKGSAPYCFLNQTNGSGASEYVSATSTSGFTVSAYNGASVSASFTWLCVR